MSFENFGLSKELLLAVTTKGYKEPSPIQAQSIPAILKRGDVMACAQTGTGKTAGFVLPMLQILSDAPRKTGKSPRALILAPTRELAAQINDGIHEYGKHLSLRSQVVYGGVNINRQVLNLRGTVDILVATPGRLLDLYRQRAVSFATIEMLVLDEADRMLDMGFIHDIKKILAQLPKSRQNLLFSATFSPEIRKLASGLVINPIEITIAPQQTAATSIKHKLHPVDKARKSDLLSHLIRTNNWQQALVFTRTKHGANRLVEKLARDSISALAIHGNKSQSARVKALDSFKQGKIAILVATDIAARGIDIDQLPQVVNFDLPNVPEDYVHRIGRTGRAGAQGNATSLYCIDEEKELRDIERVLKNPIEKEIIAGFEPSLTRSSAPSLDDDRRPRPSSNFNRSRNNNPRNNYGPPRSRAGGARSGQRDRYSAR